MTLILSVQTPRSIWLLADRRLSAPGKVPVDNAIKIAVLQAADGVALVGYAGLGSTAIGTQPSDWIINVLTGRHYPIEVSLRTVAKCVGEEFSRHLEAGDGLRPSAHNFLAPSIVYDTIRLYSIDFTSFKQKSQLGFRLHQKECPSACSPVAVPFGICGSGTAALLKNMKWKRPLLRAIKAYESGKISENPVTALLAEICMLAHENTADGSVGPRCIVAWRNKLESPRRGGGGHVFYNGYERMTELPALPTILNGKDMRAFNKLVWQEYLKPQIEHMNREEKREEVGKFSVNRNRMNQLLSELPNKPDEKLR